MVIAYKGGLMNWGLNQTHCRWFLIKTYLNQRFQQLYPRFNQLQVKKSSCVETKISDAVDIAIDWPFHNMFVR